MALNTMPPSTRRQDHGCACSYPLARSQVTYSNERYEDNTLPVGISDSLTTNRWLRPGSSAAAAVRAAASQSARCRLMLLTSPVQSTGAGITHRPLGGY